jgi:hypothetical protein
LRRRVKREPSRRAFNNPSSRQIKIVRGQVRTLKIRVRGLSGKVAIIIT